MNKLGYNYLTIKFISQHDRHYLSSGQFIMAILHVTQFIVRTIYSANEQFIM